MSLIRRWTPPALYDALRSFRARMRGTPRPWEGVPEGWDARAGRVKGWDVDLAAQATETGWRQISEATAGTGPLGGLDSARHNTFVTFGYVLALAARNVSTLSLLDWGGAAGQYYLLAKALLPELEIEYHCRELPRMCEVGRKLLPNARFHEDDRCFDRTYDLVLASGALQYERDWKAAMERLAKSARAYLFVTRTPVVPRAPTSTALQRAHGTEVLLWLFNREELLAAAARAGAVLKREFLVQEHHAIPGVPEQPEFRGFLFRTDTLERGERE